MNIPQNIIVRLNELPIEEVADKLGLEVRRHKALCFMHNDHSPSITFSTYKNIYRCWVCGVGGGPIKLHRTRRDGISKRHVFGLVKNLMFGGQMKITGISTKEHPQKNT